MAKPKITSDPVTVTVAGTVYTLEPTLERCIAVCNVFDGQAPLLRSLANANFVAAGHLIVLGAGLKHTEADLQRFMGAVRDEGASPALYEACTRYALAVFAGGVEPDPDAEVVEDAPGNS